MAMKLNSEYYDRVYVPNETRYQEKHGKLHEELRQSFQNTRTPAGNVRLHAGTFTPWDEMPKSGTYAPPVGPYRSVGTWFEKRFNVPEEEAGDDYGKSKAKMFWPFGDKVVRLKGAHQPHEYQLDDIKMVRLIPEKLHNHTIKETRIPVLPEEQLGQKKYQYPLPLRRTHEY